jgi:hypothetical protein
MVGIYDYEMNHTNNLGRDSGFEEQTYCWQK